MDSNELFAVYPRTINHIAVSVSNLEEAIKWYLDILGFTLIKQPIEFVADHSLTGMAVKDFHGPKLKKMKIAWLTSANQVGFEIIENMLSLKPKDGQIVLSTGNQELPIFLLLIQILKDCVKESLTVEESNEVRFWR